MEIVLVLRAMALGAQAQALGGSYLRAIGEMEHGDAAHSSRMACSASERPMLHGEPQVKLFELRCRFRKPKARVPHAVASPARDANRTTEAVCGWALDRREPRGIVYLDPPSLCAGRWLVTQWLLLLARHQMKGEHDNDWCLHDDLTSSS